MQNNKILIRKQTNETTEISSKEREIQSVITFLIIITAFLSMIILPGISSGAEKKTSKKAPVQQKSASINDGNVLDYLKKAEEQVKKGEMEGSLATLIRIHDYAEDVVKTVKYFQVQYDKTVNDASVPQNDKEDILIKLKRMAQLIPKYTHIKEVAAFDIGLVYAKKGEAEKARKYLLEVLDTAPFSVKQDSLWMKSKKLLLGLYSLEGEF